MNELVLSSSRSPRGLWVAAAVADVIGTGIRSRQPQHVGRSSCAAAICTRACAMAMTSGRPFDNRSAVARLIGNGRSVGGVAAAGNGGATRVGQDRSLQ